MFVRTLLLIIGVSTLVWSADLRHAENADRKQVKEYVNGTMGHYSSWFTGIFYVGSDNEFDYVAVKHGKNTVKVFKIKRDELGIKHHMKINGNDKKWVNITGMFPLPQ